VRSSGKGIDVVICRHFHADHVNGLLMADGTHAFPRAEIKVPEVEWAFWMSDDEMARAGGTYGGIVSKQSAG
jgi:glyoxylase-like metal-dependent hydrolase (beta-lactamase superfamily II)